MKKILILLFIIGQSIPALLAQGPENPVSIQGMKNLAYMSPKSPGFQTFSNVNRLEGTPFLFEDWRMGRVKFTDQDTQSEEVGIMLDLQDQRLYTQLDAEFIGEFPIGKIERVELYDELDTLYFAVFDLKRNHENGPAGMKFYRVLHQGEYLLLHQETKYLRKEEYIENLGMVRRPDKFMSMDVYWLEEGSALHEIKKKQRSLEKKLPRKAARINRIIRKHKLDLKQDADLAFLFAMLEASEENR